MKTTGKTLGIALGLSVGCIATGVVLKQSLLTAVGFGGTVTGLISTTSSKQNKSNENLQIQISEQIKTVINPKLATLEHEITRTKTKTEKEKNSVQTEVITLQKEICKLQKKVQTQDTRQRLQVAAIQKLQHQQQANSGAIACVEQRFIQERQIATSKSNPLTQKPKQTPVQSLPRSSETVTRVYIDGNNLRFAVDELKIKLDYDALRVELNQESSKIRFKYYTGVHYPSTPGQQRFISYLKKLRYEVVELPILPRPDSNKEKTCGDDVKIAIDMIKEVQKGDRVILVSGDGDFVPVVKEVQHLGAKVIVAAKYNMLNQELAEIADGYINLDEIKDKIAKLEKFNVA